MKIAILSNKGGCGKSSLSVNLAGFMSASGKTLLVDDDKNRSALHWAARGGEALPFLTVGSRLAPRHWADHSHVVVDSGARPDPEDFREYAGACDVLIVVTGADPLSLDTLRPTVELLEKIGVTNFKVLLSMVPPVGRIGEEAREAIERAGWPIFRGQVRRYAAHVKAALLGRLVKDVSDPHAADAWADIEAIGRELLQ